MVERLSGARIVDGTGSPWFRGWVDIEDERITAVGRGTPPDDGAETVELGNAVLAPGFIDTHTHSDLRLFDDPELSPKVRQGITTEILGQDGFSAAPMAGNGEEWEAHLSGLNGRMERPWSWESMAGYLDEIEANGVAPNVASLVGHGTVRYNVLGMADRDPEEHELAEMADLVTAALEDGAIGFSTGLIYPPQVQAATAEVQALASRLHPYGRPFVAHIRNETNDIWNALEEFIRIGQREEIPLHLSHFKLALDPQHGKATRAIGMLEAARERGVDITADQYPYTAGSTTLDELLPDWAFTGGPEGTLRLLRNDTERDRLRDDLRQRPEKWTDIVVSGVASTENEHLEGKTIAAIANQRGVAPPTAVLDLLLEEELEVSKITHMLDEADVREILQCERVCIATDGLFGGKPHPRTYGTYPRVLGRYVREQNLVSLEGAVRMMTALPARAMGLCDRGVIRPGMKADITVFDPDTVAAAATYEKPAQYPEGVEHVLVNGSFVVRGGAMTGALPGTAIRA